MLIGFVRSELFLAILSMKIADNSIAARSYFAVNKIIAVEKNRDNL